VGSGRSFARVGRAGASETEEAEHWTRGEVETLVRLARVHESRFAPLLVLLFATGLRRGEALGIQWPDVDLDSRVLTVRRAVTKEGVTTPKSGKPRRVPMTAGLAEELFDLLAARRRDAADERWPDVPLWVFCSEVGGTPDPSNTERTWLRLRRRAHQEGVRPLKLHCTRHTWATFALEAGRSVRWVADVLGHADPAFTLRVYAHAMRTEEGDLSFADFGRTEPVAEGPGRPYTTPAEGAALPEGRDARSPVVEFERDSDDFAPDDHGGPGQSRTGDTRIFSAVLYQLSYRATGTAESTEGGQRSPPETRGAGGEAEPRRRRPFLRDAYQEMQRARHSASAFGPSATAMSRQPLTASNVTWHSPSSFG
jgi:hypothetical protein